MVCNGIKSSSSYWTRTIYKYQHGISASNSETFEHRKWVKKLNDRKK